MNCTKSLIAFAAFIVLFSSSIYGQPQSDPDEIVWTEEDHTSSTDTTLFDNEERANPLLRFFDIDSKSDAIEIIDVESFDEIEEMLPVKTQKPDNKQPATTSGTTRAKTTADDDIMLFDENNEFVTETELEKREKAKKQEEKYAAKQWKSDSIRAYVKRLADQWDYTPFDDRMTNKDTIIVNPIFMPFIFDGKVLPDDYQLYNPDLYRPKNNFEYKYTTEEAPIFTEKKRVDKINHEMRNYVVQNHPDVIKYNVNQLPDDIPVAVEITRPSLLTRMFEIDETPIINSTGTPGQFVPKIKYWVTNGNSSMQFSQNYLSPNWAAGANSSVNLISVNEFTANYNNKKRFKLDNTLLYRLSLTNAQGDSLRAIRIGEDMFRYKTSAGLKAAKGDKWYYTISGFMETQFFKNYQINSSTINTAFISPLATNVGLGMEYKTTITFAENKYKRIYIHANLAPISITYKYTNRPELNLTGYGFELDQRSFYDVGTKIDVNLNVNFTRFIKWDSKLYLFTTYKSADMFFENTFDFAINQYFSTRIYLNLKYNSKSVKYEKVNENDKNYMHTRLQMNELLSFGFSYKW